MLGSGDIDYMDPNISYYSIGYLNLRMWSRQLFTYPADPGSDNTEPVADLATDMPTTANGEVSADGKTYTIKIRPGAKWSTTPARQVTAADVVRGVKRTANPVQPFGGIPDFANLIVGYKAFSDGFTGDLHFSASLHALSNRDDFADHLAPVRRAEWVVYAKPPFAGPPLALTLDRSASRSLDWSTGQSAAAGDAKSTQQTTKNQAGLGQNRSIV